MRLELADERGQLVGEGGLVVQAVDHDVLEGDPAPAGGLELTESVEQLG